MIMLNVVLSLIAPIKPHSNFKLKGFFSFDPIKFSFGSKSIMANETIMRPSMELISTLQNGGTSLCVKSVSFSNNVHSAKEKHMHPTYFSPYLSKTKNPKKLEWELSWAFHDVWAIKLPWVKVVMALIITRCLWSSAKFTFFLKKKEVCCPLF